MIRRCRKQDLTQVLNIERISFIYPYDRCTFLYFLMREPEGFSVYEDKGRVVGYIITSVIGDKGTIISIAVIPELRRMGIGSNLLRESLNFLSKKVRKVDLQVRSDNQGTINFYKKSGFREVGLICNYYPDGVDALIMSKNN